MVSPQVQAYLDNVSSYIWGMFFLIPLLVGTGLYLTFRLRGLQFHKLGKALKLAVLKRKGADDDAGDISQFQALATAMAATVGTGNIVGVSTAIAIGGPGALVWMWVTGILGMATKYAECFLAVRFRTTDSKGEKSGGPQYYLERGIKGPFGKILGLSFAIFAVIACFGIGNMTQGNSIAENLNNTWSMPHWLTGVLLALFTLIVLVGGIKSIGRVSASIVPAMVALYLVAQTIVLIFHFDAIPAAFVTIFADAFTGTSAVGGFAGAAVMLIVQTGVARGLFSNESGLGSAAMAAAAAKTSHPTQQGLVQMTQTFIDTIIMVSFTGVMLVVTGVWQTPDADGNQISPALMVGEAFNTVLPGTSGFWLVSICVLLFASTTIIGWSYYGERNVERLFGRRGVMPFRVIFSIVVYFGCTVELAAVWTFSDIANGLMALPNLIGLIVLSGLVARETKHYLENDPQLNAGHDEVEKFMAGRPGWADWKAGDVIGSSRTLTGRAPSKRLNDSDGPGGSSGVGTAVH